MVASSSSAAPRLTVFFDGACPLCAKEIGLYRQCQGAADLEWIDISKTNEDQVAPGLSRTDAMQRFHVMTADGQVTSGGRAFAELWSSLPALAWVGHIMRRWPLSALLELLYRGFLPLRPMLQRLLKARR